MGSRCPVLRDISGRTVKYYKKRQIFKVCECLPSDASAKSSNLLTLISIVSVQIIMVEIASSVATSITKKVLSTDACSALLALYRLDSVSRMRPIVRDTA